jgi:hypothetical protein
VFSQVAELNGRNQSQQFEAADQLNAVEITTGLIILMNFSNLYINLCRYADGRPPLLEAKVIAPAGQLLRGSVQRPWFHLLMTFREGEPINSQVHQSCTCSQTAAHAVHH